MIDHATTAQDWSSVAASWDEHVSYVDEHSAESTDALVDRLGVKPGERVLELASGPGSLARTWSDLVGPSGRVVLSDIAPGMVEVARRRAAALPNVKVAVVDATAIDFPDDTFDVVASRMGLMFAPDPSVALAEAKRVLTRGGRLGALVWGSIDQNPWMTCVGMAAMSAGVAKGGPPVGPGGMFSLGDPDQLRGLATAAGFAGVTVEAFPVTFRSPDLDTHISRITALAGPLADALAHATADQHAALRSTAAELARPFTSDTGLELPGRALLVTGRVE